MRNFFTLLLILSIGISFSGCSKTDNIKDWLKEGTKEYQKEKKKVTKSNKDGIQNLLERKHLIIHISCSCSYSQFSLGVFCDKR